MPVPDVTGLITAQQAARKLGMTRNAFYQHVTRGQLTPVHTISNRRFYDPTAIDAWASTRNPPGRPKGARVKAPPGWLTAGDLAQALTDAGKTTARNTITTWVKRGKIPPPDRPGNNGAPSLWSETTALAIIANMTRKDET